MTPINPLDNLQAYLERVVAEHDVPAASVAVWKDNQVYQAATGCLNIHTGVQATTDSVFQIGSITKVMTTCLLMQLVDEGRINLDKPVKHYLQDFQVADREASQTITVRQCLNHTSGIAGDFFPDETGASGNLIARFVDRCNALPIIHPVGEMLSYCNSSFGIAGRLLEVVAGCDWYQAMESRIFEPLGMSHAFVRPTESIRFNTAMGHVLNDQQQWQHSEQTYLPLGMAPVGAVATMRAVDLITFARAHLDGGLNQKGESWLSKASVEAMQTPQMRYPPASQSCQLHAGIGWQIMDQKQRQTRIVNHGGATCGSLAMLQLCPEHNSAFAILLNGFKAAPQKKLVEDLQLAVAGVDMREPEIVKAAVSEARLDQLAGDYECLDYLMQVRRNDKGTLNAHVVMKIDPVPPTDVELVPLDQRCFAMLNGSGARLSNLAFVDDTSSGPPQYLFHGSRLSQRR